jgi:phosphohistidine phosphatase SixA
LPTSTARSRREGECASRKLAKYIRRKRIRPALVLCSPALRTRQTLEPVEASLGKRCVVEEPLDGDPWNERDEFR